MAAPFSYESYNNSSSAPAPVAVSSSSRASRTVAFVLRILTLICLLISMVILTTNTATLQVFTNFSAATGPNIVGITIHFKDIYTYRYLLGATVFGMAYMLLQIVVTLCYLAKGGNGSLLFDFYGDKVVSYILATGSAAAFGATRDMKPLFAGVGNVDKFFNKGYASASLLLLGFVCTAILSVMSSYALPKRH